MITVQFAPYIRFANTIGLRQCPTSPFDYLQRDGNQTQLTLLVTIRDTADCVVSVNLSTVLVIVDVSSISQLVDQLSKSENTLTTNPLVRLLSSGNQNTVTQLITSLSHYFNRIDGQSVADAVSSRLNLLTDRSSQNFFYV